MKPLLFLFTLTIAPMWGVDPPTRQVPVEITHEKGSFSGQLSVSIIEIDGEFIGNTPTTVTAKEGSVTVKVTKAGFQPWERTLKLNPGDKRTLNTDLVK